jgi:hypothetical protein
MADAWLACGTNDFAKQRILFGVHKLVRAATGRKYPSGTRNDILAVTENDVTAQHIRVSTEVLALVAAEVAAPSGLLEADEAAGVAYGYNNRVTSSPGAAVDPPKLTYTGGDYLLLVALGQSNMSPMATATNPYPITDFPSAERGEQLGALGCWWINNGTAAHSGGWRRAQPPIMHYDGLKHGGCVIACVRKLLETYPRVAFVQVTLGGTSLGVNWQPGAAARDTFDRFLAEALATFPHPITDAAIIMANGESDTDTIGRANAFGTNVTALISDIRSAIGFPAARVVMAELDPTLVNGGSWPYTATVLAAQKSVAATVPNVRTITGVDFLIGSSDSVHGTPAKAQARGVAFANAITGA